MSDKELRNALLQLDATDLAGVADLKQQTWRVLERDRRRVRWLTLLSIAIWLFAAALICAAAALATCSRSVSFISESLTEAERNRAEAAVQKQFTTDLSIVATASTRIANVTGAIGRIRGDAAQQRDQKITALTRISDISLTPAIATEKAISSVPF